MLVDSPTCDLGRWRRDGLFITIQLGRWKNEVRSCAVMRSSLLFHLCLPLSSPFFKRDELPLLQALLGFSNCVFCWVGLMSKGPLFAISMSICTPIRCLYARADWLVMWKWCVKKTEYRLFYLPYVHLRGRCLLVRLIEDST